MFPMAALCPFPVYAHDALSRPDLAPCNHRRDRLFHLFRRIGLEIFSPLPCGKAMPYTCSSPPTMDICTRNQLQRDENKLSNFACDANPKDTDLPNDHSPRQIRIVRVGREVRQ
jgi:hypothetical protein